MPILYIGLPPFYYICSVMNFKVINMLILIIVYLTVIVLSQFIKLG